MQTLHDFDVVVLEDGRLAIVDTSQKTSDATVIAHRPMSVRGTLRDAYEENYDE